MRRAGTPLTQREAEVKREKDWYKLIRENESVEVEQRTRVSFEGWPQREKLEHKNLEQEKICRMRMDRG